MDVASRCDELPDSCIPPRPMVGLQQAIKPESPGLSRRRERAGIPVPNIGRAATSGKEYGRTSVHTGKSSEWSGKPTGREEHSDSNHE